MGGSEGFLLMSEEAGKRLLRNKSGQIPGAAFAPRFLLTGGPRQAPGSEQPAPQGAQEQLCPKDPPAAIPHQRLMRLHH